MSSSMRIRVLASEALHQYRKILGLDEAMGETWPPGTSDRQQAPNPGEETLLL